MRSTIIFIAACACVSWATAQTYVNPYTKKDGTFVQGHMRSAPNSTPDDNYSTRGNSNPFTGQQGTQRPSYEQPTYQAPAFPQPPRGPVCGLNQQGFYVCQ